MGWVAACPNGWLTRAWISQTLYGAERRGARRACQHLGHEMCFGLCFRLSSSVHILQGGGVGSMIRTSKLALCGVVVGALVAGGSVAQAQMSHVKVDPNLAKRGQFLWQSRGCTGCHSIGKGRVSGPDLLGVTERRSVGWLKAWLKSSNSSPV